MQSIAGCGCGRRIVSRYRGVFRGEVRGWNLLEKPAALCHRCLGLPGTARLFFALGLAYEPGFMALWLCQRRADRKFLASCDRESMIARNYLGYFEKAIFVLAAILEYCSCFEQIAHRLGSAISRWIPTFDEAESQPTDAAIIFSRCSRKSLLENLARRNARVRP